jgi:hypothetical protein
MLALFLKLEIWKLRNYITSLGLQEIGIRILAIFILFITLHNNTKSLTTKQNSFELELFLIVMCVYWIFAELFSGRFKRGIKLANFYKSINRVTLIKPINILLINILDSLIKQWLSVIFLIAVISQDINLIAKRGLILFCFFSLVHVNDFFYSLLLTGYKSLEEKKKLYLINLVGFCFALATGLCSIANIYWSFVQENILVMINIFVIATIYIYNGFLCISGGYIEAFKSAAFKEEELQWHRTGNLNNLFVKLYTKTKKYTGNKVLAFCFAKEITQIFMEFVPLTGGICMGIFMIALGLSPIFTIEEKPNACSAMYILAVSYFALITTMNFLARENSTEWILKSCKINFINFFTGKLLANYCVSVFGTLFFFSIYKIILVFWLSKNSIWVYIIYYGLLAAIPLGVLWGVIWGAYLVPRIDIYDGQVNYLSCENGMGILFIFFSGFFIETPLRKLLFATSEIFSIGMCGCILYVLVLFMISKRSIKRKMFQKI